MSEMFEKAAIIGTGLMGGSLAMALKASPRVGSVTGFDSSEETRERSRALEIADEIAASASEAARDADLIFIATPAAQ